MLKNIQDPQDPEPWSGVRDALVEGNKSCQYDKWSGKCIGDEDCLYLNVYTKEVIFQLHFNLS